MEKTEQVTIASLPSIVASRDEVPIESEVTESIRHSDLYSSEVEINGLAASKVVFDPVG